MRKKFTMLFAALLACVGVAKAQFVETSTADAPKYYVIASYNRGGYLTNKGVGSAVEHVDLADGSYWYFEAADNGGVHFVNKLKGEDDAKIYLGSDKTASATAATWYVLENGVNKKGFSISSTAAISGSSCIDANNHNTGVGGWNPSANDWHGTTWVFVEAATLQDAIYNPNGLIFRTRADRYVTSVALNGSFNNSAALNHDYKGDNGLVYNDLTETVTMKAVAGEEVTASITREGGWTNAYVYIDYDNDGFTAGINEEDGFTPAEDLVSYSFYSGDETNGDSGKNSAGDELTGDARNTISLPSFKAPAAPGTYRLRFKLDWNSINPNGDNANFVGDGGSFIDVTLKVFASTIDVVYSYQYNGEEKYTQTTSHLLVGDAFPELTETPKFPYGITATKPAGVIAEADVVEGKVTKVIELKDNLPFTCAAKVDAVSDWYHLIFHANHLNYLYYTADDVVLEANKTTVDANDKDAYTWAFVGNPYDGFKVYNKKAEKYLDAAKDGAVVNATEQVFKLTGSSSGTKGFYMQAVDGDKTDRFNKQGGKVVYWSGADAGSTFMVELRDDSQALIDLVASAQEIFANLGEGTIVGCVTADSKATISDAITAANTALANKTGILAAQAALQAAINGLVTIQPEENAFYVLKNNHTGRYMNVNSTAGLIATTAVGIGEVFQFIKDNGSLYLKNVERGTYLSTALPHAYGQNSAGATTVAGAKSVVVKNLGKGNQVSITPNGGATLHHDTNSNNIVAWDGSVDSKSSWSIEAVDITALAHVVSISEIKWATLVLGYDAIIPDGVTAYAVTEAGDGVVKLTEITGKLSAFEAVLLNAEAGSYRFEYAVSAEAFAGNLLAGSTINTNVEGPGYVLSAKEGNVGLYKATLNKDNNTAFLNNAFKAYLPAPAGAGAAMFSLDRGEGTTSINNAQLTINSENMVIYDLTGRRVEKMEKGIYIVNGKKVVLK